MFLNTLKKRNPELIEIAVDFHQNRILPPNTWIIDLDTIASNAQILAEKAREYHLTTYVMSKQFCRNPLVNLVAIKNGLYKVVAVDIQGAKILPRYGVPIGHIGHLNQIPRCDLEFALNLNPDVITVFSLEFAEEISQIAQKMGNSSLFG